MILLISTLTVTAYIAHSCVALVVWRPQTVFFSPDDSASNYFGLPIAIDGDTIVVGASQDRTERTSLKNWNVAYVYKQNETQWELQSPLQGEGFRDDVRISLTGIDISGDTIALGVVESPRMDLAKQFLYIFVRQGDTWVRQAKIASPDPKKAEFFASSVALDGNSLVVNNYGEFLVFIKNSTTGEWSYQATLRLPKREPDDSRSFCLIGPAVDISGDTVVIGSADNFLANCAHVFVRNPLTQTWQYQVELKPQIKPRSPNGFGRSVAIDGDTILVGAANEGHSWRSFGAVYAYRRNPETKAWTPVARLWPRGGNLIVGSYSFGASTAIKGNAIAVGVQASEEAVYLFNYDRESGRWNQRAKILPKEWRSYGEAIPALTEQHLVIGDTSALNGKKRGGFYVFNLLDSSNTKYFGE